MARLIIGAAFGIALTAQGVFSIGVGHGSLAPWVFAASFFAFMPLLAFAAGPLLWAFYFLTIPNLERLQTRVIAICGMLLAHILPGCWLAYTDPAFARLGLLELAIFFLTFLVAISSLLFLTFKSKNA